MLIKERYADVQTTVDGKESTMRIFIFHPVIAGYPNARFPGVALFSEIYQVTGPVARFARQIAGQGYIVAAPSSYHDFTGPEPLAYDVPGTDQGNEWKVKKLEGQDAYCVGSVPAGPFYHASTLTCTAGITSGQGTLQMLDLGTLDSYDADSRATVTHLLSLPTCTGRIGATGMCLGGHLAVRAAVADPARVSASVAYFPTDIHSRTLGPYTSPNSSPDPPASPDGSPSAHTLDNFPLLKNRTELALIFGIRDTHVPDAGRDLIRAKLREAGVTFSWHEFAWAQHAFIRDELSKGRYDPAVTKACFEVLLEVFGRVLRTELGEPEEVEGVEHVC